MFQAYLRLSKQPWWPPFSRTGHDGSTPSKSTCRPLSGRPNYTLTSAAPSPGSTATRVTTPPPTAKSPATHPSATSSTPSLAATASTRPAPRAATTPAHSSRRTPSPGTSPSTTPSSTRSLCPGRPPGADSFSSPTSPSPAPSRRFSKASPTGSPAWRRSAGRTIRSRRSCFRFPWPCAFSSDIDLSGLLVYTPLLLNPLSTTVITYPWPSDAYFIGLTSIKVNGKTVALNQTLLRIDDEFGIGWTKLSTATSYTVLETYIYRAFTELFIKESSALNLTARRRSSHSECATGRNIWRKRAWDRLFRTLTLRWKATTSSGGSPERIRW
ncbi:hypothetical protein TIFTF001_017946 [Ficus carica]|uniref:Xylanase inhibitor C-terminal domain-containing protein n=1 Tax=Ficus carica TaxID=3494 RepID=A0AA88AA84_FICCA|nr:hypothetical protein TIFTF001_017946 [Ficus carica]